MAHLPEGYRISPDRVPVPGTKITEAVGIEHLQEVSDVKQAEADREARIRAEERDETKTIVIGTVFSMLGAAAVIGGRRAYKHWRDGKET